MKCHKDYPLKYSVGTQGIEIARFSFEIDAIQAIKALQPKFGTKLIIELCHD